MFTNDLLQAYLFVIIFLLGVLSMLAVKYFRAHLVAKEEQPPVPSSRPHQAEEPLPPAVRQHLQHEAETKFESAVRHSSDKLQQDLDVSVQHIRNLVNRLATEIVADEMERYRRELASLRAQAQTEMGTISAQVAEHEEELKTKMAEELETEKQKLINQIDTKLADAVGSFLSETLQHNVDLGSQNAYLISMLEEHKADFIKEVGDGQAEA